jgi:hypothetical protein
VNTLMYLWFYFLNLALALDQLLNTLLAGDYDETLSRRAGRAAERKEKWACVLCKLLDYIDPRHCLNTWEAPVDEEGFNSVAKRYGRWLESRKT